MGAPSDERVSLQVECKKATLPCSRVGTQQLCGSEERYWCHHCRGGQWHQAGLDFATTGDMLGCPHLSSCALQGFVFFPLQLLIATLVRICGGPIGMGACRESGCGPWFRVHVLPIASSSPQKGSCGAGVSIGCGLHTHTHTPPQV